MPECLGVARQRWLQQQMHSPESISRDLILGALRLARQPRSGDPGGEELRRRGWRSPPSWPPRIAVRRVGVIAGHGRREACEGATCPTSTGSSHEIERVPDGPADRGVLRLRRHAHRRLLRAGLLPGPASPTARSGRASCWRPWSRRSTSSAAAMTSRTWYGWPPAHSPGAPRATWTRWPTGCSGTKIAGMVYPDARVLLERTGEQGHTLAMASSATRFQTSVAAKDLGIENILVTEVDSRGRGAHRSGDGPVLWGEGKADAVRAFRRRAGHRPGAVVRLRQRGRGRAVPRHGRATRGRSTRTTSWWRPRVERGWPVARLTKVHRARPGQIARSAAAYVGLGAGVVAGVGLGLINRDRRTALDGRGLRRLRARARRGRRPPARCTGRRTCGPRRPAVFLFNHQSQLDVLSSAPCCAATSPRVAKKELGTTRCSRRMGWLADVAYVDRSNTSSGQGGAGPRRRRACGRGRSLVIAPEGTRSPTPRLLPFKKGAFHMAMQAGVPWCPSSSATPGSCCRPRRADRRRRPRRRGAAAGRHLPLEGEDDRLPRGGGAAAVPRHPGRLAGWRLTRSSVVA